MPNPRIEQLSPVQETQALLRTLDADGDGAIAKGEVDADGDGYLDCSPNMRGELAIYPSQAALFRAGLLTHLRRTTCEGLEPSWRNYLSPPGCLYEAEELYAMQHLKRDSNPSLPRVVDISVAALREGIPEGVTLLSGRTPEQQQCIQNAVMEGRIDGLVLAPVPITMQKTLDDYLTAPEQTAIFQRAKAALLLEFKQGASNVICDPTIDPHTCPFYAWLIACRAHHIPVKAAGVDPTYYEQRPVGRPESVELTTRGVIIAGRIPPGTRVVVISPSALLRWYPGANLQDFIAEQAPERPINLVDFGE